MPVQDGVNAAMMNPDKGKSPRSRIVEWVACICLAVASLGLVLWHVPNHTTVSPIDEYVYIDYLAKVPTQLVVHRGEETGDYARKYLACHGVRTIGYYPDAMCTSPNSSQETRLPNAGLTSADLYTPLYFGATWLMAQPLQFLGVDDLTAAGRYSGWVWLAAASILLYLSLRRWKVPVFVAWGAGILLVGSLPAYWSNTYISTDATALFAGALMLFGASLFRKPTRGSIALLTVFAVLVSLLKLQNLMAVGTVSLSLVVLAGYEWHNAELTWRQRIGGFLRDRRTLAAGVSLACAVLAQGIWVVIRSAIAVGALPDQGVSAPFGKTAFLNEVIKFLPGVSSGALSPSILGLGAIMAFTVTSWIVVAGVLGLLASSKRGSTDEALAISTLVVALVAGPLLAVVNIKVGGYYFDLPARYGMSLLPFFIACAALLFARKTWIAWMLPLFGLISFVAVLSIPENI